jgi:hypothetical protein
MTARPLTLIASFALAALFALEGCAADPGSPNDEATADLSAVSVTPAHFSCTAPHSVDLDVVTAHASVKVTAVPGDTSATGRLRSDGSANLGEFLSEDHETYSIKLDAKMLRGEAGRAVLTTEEPDGPPAVDDYTCELASGGAGSAPKMCRDGALADGHLQPGRKGGPDSKSVVSCDAGYTLCRIDPNGPDNDVCGDADDCFACSR